MKILLVEPNYVTKFAPLGLMRISSYHKSKGDYVQYIKGNRKINFYPDKIYITTLFTYEYKEVTKTIRFYKAEFPESEIWVGGILASLMPDLFKKEGVKVHIGLLKRVENYPPDYSLFPDMDYSYSMTSRGCINKCAFCLHPNQEIFTTRGFKKIKEMTILDEVIVDKNYNLEGIYNRNYEGEMYEVLGYKFNIPLLITANHKISILRNNQEIECEAKDLQLKDCLKIPILKTKDNMGITKEFLKLCGYYLSEGSISKHKNRKDSYTLAFTFNKKEGRYLNEVKKLLKEMFNVDAKFSDTNTATQVSIHRKAVIKPFLNLFGKGARNKYIVLKILELPEEKLYELLKGYYFGDGSLVKSSDGKIRIKCNSASKSLIYSIFLILIKLGYNPCLNRRKTQDIIQGRKVNVSEWFYGIDISKKEEVDKLAKIIYGEDFSLKLKKKYTEKQKKDFVKGCSESGNITKYSKEQGIIFQNFYAWKKEKIKRKNSRYKKYYLIPIKNIRKESYSGKVWNIGVKDIHKYLCSGILVNNCIVPKIEGNLYSRDWLKDINLNFKKIIFMDNNWLAKDKKEWLRDVKKLKELVKKGINEIDFNQSLDCREAKEFHFKQMQGLPINPIRFSFDHLGQDKFIQEAIKLSYKYGFNHIHVDVLYNWNDTIDDFYYRIKELIRLIGKKGGGVILMKYAPIDRTDRNYVGKYWTKREAESVHRINPYPYGIISSKSMKEFEYFFGKNAEEFKKLLNFKDIRRLSRLKMKKFCGEKIWKIMKNQKL